MSGRDETTGRDKLDRVIAEARRQRELRSQDYRAKALEMYAWVCGRCGREFTHKNLRELTVHHRDHDHDNNPADGSNWELLCVYCHDNEHARHVDHIRGTDYERAHDREPITHRPFADLESLIKKDK